MAAPKNVERPAGGWGVLATDLAVGIGIAVLVVLIVAALSGAVPTFVYQMF